MGIYGYCVVPAGHSVVLAKGIDDAPVRAQRIEGLAILVSDVPRPEPTVKHVRQHNTVIEAAVTHDVTPVPLRFGQWAGELDSFSSVLVEKAEWYHERLTAFAGAMEFGLRVVRPGPPPPARVVHVPAASTGLEYMKALRERVAAERVEGEEVEQVRAGISEAVTGIVREERAENARTPRGLLTVAHLVARPDFDAYREAAQGLRNRFPELRFLVSGPWMPYSFAV
ncbi:MAG: GvpL/GvpF family gas vesicle protein [Gemmatimonadota bacterium]